MIIFSYDKRLDFDILSACSELENNLEQALMSMKTDKFVIDNITFTSDEIIEYFREMLMSNDKLIIQKGKNNTIDYWINDNFEPSIIYSYTKYKRLVQ